MTMQAFKKAIVSIIILGQLLAAMSTFAAVDPRDNAPSRKNEVLAKSSDLSIHTLNKHNSDVNVKWAKGDFKTQTSGETTFGIKAFSVIAEYAKQVLFTQYGLSKDTDGNTLNAGLGFYHLMPMEIAVGGNIFYDAKTGTESILNPFGEGVHKRFSVGGKIMTSKIGAFFNIYKGLSNSLAAYKVSDGYDFGINGLVPRYESIRLGFTQYNFNENEKGNKFTVEYKPNSFFTFGIEQDQSYNPRASIYIETKYEFNTPFDEQLKPITSTTSHVWSQRYTEVERDNTVIKEEENQEEEDQEEENQEEENQEEENQKPISPATLGATEYNAVDLIQLEGQLLQGYKAVYFQKLENYHHNEQDVSFSSTGSNLILRNGTPAELDQQLKTEINQDSGDCYATYYGNGGDDHIAILVKQGLSCNVIINFAGNKLYSKKTETVRFYADPKIEL